MGFAGLFGEASSAKTPFIIEKQEIDDNVKVPRSKIENIPSILDIAPVLGEIIRQRYKMLPQLGPWPIQTRSDRPGVTQYKSPRIG